MNDNTNYLCPCIIQPKREELNWTVHRDLIWFEFYTFSLLCFGTIGWDLKYSHSTYSQRRCDDTFKNREKTEHINIVAHRKKSPKIKYIKKIYAFVFIESPIERRSHLQLILKLRVYLHELKRANTHNQWHRCMNPFS